MHFLQHADLYLFYNTFKAFLKLQVYFQEKLTYYPRLDIYIASNYKAWVIRHHMSVPPTERSLCFSTRFVDMKLVLAEHDNGGDVHCFDIPCY